MRAQLPFIVNDRADVAVALNADGVHMGQGDLPLDATRNIVGKDKIIGVSAETPAEGREAEQMGADYIGVGPVFSTGTKPDAGTPIGIDGLKKVVDAVSIPVVAIGGITIENISDVIRCGAAGAAVISAIIGSEDPESAARKLADAIEEARK